MKQYEAVIGVMKDNGGYATLGHLYRTAIKVPGVKWGSKTPFASMRRIVQDPRFFFRIRPGLWALNEWRNRIPFDPADSKRKEAVEFSHSYYQGLLIEIGNFRKLGTFVPNQDKNRKFIETPLGQLRNVNEIHLFSYPRFVDCASTIDVTWFNERKMPFGFFEVEHSTDIEHSLVKFVELQDFSARFVIVADAARESEFNSKLSLTAFSPIVQRTKFWNYESVAAVHAKESESVASPV